RPHRWQRLRRRILYFGVFSSFAIFAVVAIVGWLSDLTEWHSHELQELARLLVGLRRRHHRDVHAARLVDLHVVDLRKQQLVAQAKRVVAAAVETARRHALEVADARQ